MSLIHASTLSRSIWSIILLLQSTTVQWPSITLQLSYIALQHGLLLWGCCKPHRGRRSTRKGVLRCTSANNGKATHMWQVVFQGKVQWYFVCLQIRPWRCAFEGSEGPMGVQELVTIVLYNLTSMWVVCMSCLSLIELLLILLTTMMFLFFVSSLMQWF